METRQSNLFEQFSRRENSTAGESLNARLMSLLPLTTVEAVLGFGGDLGSDLSLQQDLVIPNNIAILLMQSVRSLTAETAFRQIMETA
jgi:hypothetical protein